MFTTELGAPQRLLFDVKQRMTADGRTKHLSRVLSGANIGLKRVDFDPANPEHRLIFAHFLVGGGWREGVTFHVEAPHMTVPATVVNKLLVHYLADELVTAAATAEAVAQAKAEAERCMALCKQSLAEAA